jgi:hypothetical protein
MTGLLSGLSDGRLLRVLSYGDERAVERSTGSALWGDRQHRQEKRNDGGIDCLKHVSKSSHQEELVLKATERQPLKALSNLRHTSHSL